ncbi:MAG TPA: MarR family winged helix-turn-helix transcriptional regulator [Ferrovibrio sp.]|jgi:DNA-binding MarR family transcriptional regulator|uniref:MarR family winged helix-turn-helix transcriptional regulator n=1 Tax=Ferrovibrio sp. TaxID=1917215 RepID=UPI002ED18858
MMTRKRSDPADAAFRQLNEEGCTVMRLHMAARLGQQLYGEYMAEAGLTSPQFGTLAFLYRDGVHAVSELAVLLGIDPTTLTRNLRLMEQRGLITQAPAAQDRRRREIRLTAEGHRVFRKALPLWQKAQATLAERLGQLQVADLNRRLDDALPRLRGT